MPIKGLTTQAPQFPIMGKLRKGGEKKTITSKKTGKPVQIQGDDLNHFRYTSDTHPESVKAFNDLFDHPQSLTILLPYSRVDENFDAWQEVWGSGRLKHRCDGEMVHMLYDEKRKTYVYPENMTCPGGCKPVARLKVIIPQMLQAGHVGVIMLETHSKWDISGIHGALAHYYDMRQNLQGIEFVLHRYPREVSTPANGRQLKWLVGIKPNHEWILAQLDVQSQLALPSSEPLQIEAVSTDEIADVEIEDVEFAEEDPVADVINATQLKYFNTLGSELYGDAWDDKRPELVDKVSKGAFKTSKNLTLEMFDVLIGGIQKKLDARNPEQGALIPAGTPSGAHS